MITLSNILVATDFGQASQAALTQGRALADAFGAQLHLLHVIAEPLREPWVGFTPSAELPEVLERLRAHARTRLQNAVGDEDVESGRVILATVWGDPADGILQYADKHDIDLIVCGTHGRRGWNHAVMGSVAERVVRLAHCPVWSLRARAEAAVQARAS